MNAAATGGEEETAVKKGNGENGGHSRDGADPVDAPATQPLTDSDGKSAAVTAPGMSSTASVDESTSSSQATTQSADAEDTEPDELPRKRRGILLGTRPGQAIPDAVDDGKSLSWMATQAVKAVNAVKASQLEQAQAWKDGAGAPEDEQSRLAEDDVATVDAGESVAMKRQEPVQPSPDEAPATIEAMPPVEPSQEATTTPRIPPGARAVAPRVPARMALMLGVLVMFGYAGYRHWFSGDHAASNATATTSDIIESAGPAEEVKLMTPPPISVVAAPEPAADHPTPPADEVDMAPPPVPATAVQSATAGPAAEEVKLMTPPPISVVAAPEPAADHPTPPADEVDMAPPPVPATAVQSATAGPAAEEVKLMTSPPISVVAAPEPAADHPTPPADEVDMAPPPVPATAVQSATAGPAAEEVKLMTPPPISVVAAPEPAADHLTPPADEVDMAPPLVPATAVQSATAGPAAEEVKLMTPPPISVEVAPEPAADHPTPPADAQPATVMAPHEPATPAVNAQEAAAGNTSQPAPSNPASAAMPQRWYPSAVPAAPSPASEADMSARQPVRPSSTPPAETDAAASQPAPPPSPAPAVEAKAPARQPVTPAPAARSRYPANGYGYHQPPSSWQPYYQPGYQQTPARR